MLPLLLACSAPEEPVVDTGPALEESPIGIATIEPGWGPVDGGTEVLITGWGFDGDVSVTFGEQPLTVTRIDETALQVTTEPWAFHSTVPVEVTSDLGTITVDDGWLFADEEPGDTGLSLAGTTRAYVELEVDRWGWVAGRIVHHTPTTASWFERLPPLEGCHEEPRAVSAGPTHVDWIDPAGDRLAGDTVVLHFQDASGEHGYYASYGGNTMPVEDRERLAWRRPGGWEVGEVLEVPRAFESVPDFGQLVLRRTGETRLSWSPKGPDQVWIRVTGLSDTAIRSIACLTEDNGEFDLPGQALALLDPGPVSITLARQRTHRMQGPWSDKGALESLARVSVSGVATVE